MAFWNPVANVVVGSVSQETLDFDVLAWHPTDIRAVKFAPAGKACSCAGVSSSGKHSRQHLALLSGTLPPPLIYTHVAFVRSSLRSAATAAWMRLPETTHHQMLGLNKSMQRHRQNHIAHVLDCELQVGRTQWPTASKLVIKYPSLLQSRPPW